MGNRNDSRLKMMTTKADNGSEDSEKRNDLHSRQRSPEPKAGLTCQDSHRSNGSQQPGQNLTK